MFSNSSRGFNALGKLGSVPRVTSDELYTLKVFWKKKIKEMGEIFMDRAKRHGRAPPAATEEKLGLHFQIETGRTNKGRWYSFAPRLENN